MTTSPDSEKKRCRVCSAEEIYHRTTAANGGYGPRLLQGLGRLFKPAMIDVYLCAACGHLEFCASVEVRKNVRNTPSWRRLK